MKRRHTAVVLGATALFASTFIAAGVVSPSAASTSEEDNVTVVTVLGGGETPPQEVQDLVNPPAPEPPTGSVMHPSFPLLDADGTNVLDSGEPISTLNTCGQCHDSGFIVEHNFHASVGMTDLSAPGTTGSGRAWDISNGLFGRWNPITYGYVTPRGDDIASMSTADWIMSIGKRHAGSGPATTARDGSPLMNLAPDASNPEASFTDPATGESAPWNWQDSGVEELNCFLCHTPTANNDARIAELEAGRFAWANTATLADTSLVAESADGWEWNPESFTENGTVDNTTLPIGRADDEACGQCHGVVHTGTDPIDGTTLLGGWETLTTGQVFSDQRLSDSGLNFGDKPDLTRSWDIHAERGVSCVSCHGSLNDTAQVAEEDATRPDHLIFDPRRSDPGDYLYQPVHEFAKGDTAQGTVAPEYDNTMRTCTSCHDPSTSHEWLPYAERHMQKMSCETCHIPTSSAPAAEQYDWTVIHTDGTPLTTIRGADGPVVNASTMITGFTPVVMANVSEDGTKRLGPYNLVGSWYWAHGSGTAERPVRAADLEAAFLDGSTYVPEIAAAFDADGNGTITDAELAIDTEVKENVVKKRLEGLGLQSPHIVGEIQPYSVSHGVVGADWATKDCQACHSSDSVLSAAMPLGDHVPGGVMPTFVGDSHTEHTGDLIVADDGSIVYRPSTTADGIDVLGSDAGGWADWLGLLAFIGVVLFVLLHATLRFLARRKYGKPEGIVYEETYLYDRYERFWHWMQAVAIIGLVLTGIVIHWPTGAETFKWMVYIHNILGALLLLNAVIALIDALATGFIKQFIPHPKGFFSQAITQAVFYMRGIFLNEPHPFEKSPGQKLNPLQQMTYLVILNVLLPAQMLTGVLIWGAQRWPDLTDSLGGLRWLLPIHTLIAWFFAAFVVLHVYLTTLGPTPLSSIRGMITGWEEVEVDHTEQEVVS
jgi:thiosulfate reductase cytochrome b subunit